MQMNKTIVVVAIMLFVFSSFVSAIDTLGVGKVDFLSNAPELNKPGFLLVATENGRSESVMYDELKQDAQAGVPQGTEVKQNGLIEAKIIDYQLQYPISLTSTNILKADIIGSKFTINPWGVDGLNVWCNGLMKDGLYAIPIAGLTIFNQECVRISSDGTIGKIDNSVRTKFTESIDVKLDDGSIEHLTISDANQAVKSLDGNVYVSWTGELNSLASKPTIAADYAAIYKSEGISLTTKSSTNAYVNFANTLKAKLNSPTNPVGYQQFCKEKGCTSVEGMIKLINDEQKNIVVTSYTQYENNINFQEATKTGVFSILPPKENLVMWGFPVFKMVINADWVGIYRPVGKPVIVSSSSPCTVEGQSGKIDLRIRNAANVAASFSVGITCDGGFTPLNQNPIQFAANEVKDLSFFYSGETASKTTGVCNVVVKDANNPTNPNTATKGQSVCVIEANQCINVGATECSSNTLRECKAVNGVNVWSPKAECEVCTNIGGVAQCTTVGKEPVCGDGVCVEGKEDLVNGTYYCLKDCQTSTSWVWWLVGIVAVLGIVAAVLNKKRK